MAMDYITTENEEAQRLFTGIDQAEKNLSTAMSQCLPQIGGEYYMSRNEVMELLHIATRTLQKMRDERRIPFTTIGGQILYPRSEILQRLKDNLHYPYPDR